MPVANRFVLIQIVGVLNVLSDEDISIVRSESDEEGFRELIRKHIAPDLKSLTAESRKLCVDSLGYFLVHGDDVFEDSLDQQQESAMIRPACARTFFRWILEEVFDGEKVNEDAHWTVSEDRQSARLIHMRT